MSTTTAAVTEQIPSSRTEPDPSRVAKGKPRSHIDGVPVYGWGQAPPYLRTQTQLGEERLKLAEGQPVLAYIGTRKYGDIPLYDPAGAEKMRPLPSSTQARMAKRRTCPECGKVRDRIVRGKQCSVCWEKARAEQQRREARTCWDCRDVSERRLPAHHLCGGCRRKQLDKQRQDAVAWVEKVTVCPGDGYGAGCSVKLVTKKEARVYQKDQGAESTWWSRAPHWPTRCPPCTETNERRDAEERAKYQADYERRQAERREAERLAAEERQRWAAAALVAPDVLVLDTETTGLDEDARIVELAVLSSGGEVLLDTLLNPGEPIPNSAFHGITDAMVASAPTFSDVLVQLTGLLDGKRCLIYNDTYDIGRLRHELTLHHLDRAAREAAEETAGTEAVAADLRARAVAEARKQAAAWLDVMRFEDVMIPYSDFVGDWDEYHGNNTWQALDGGHRAAGDCRAVLDCLRSMGNAGTRRSTPRRPRSSAARVRGRTDGAASGDDGRSGARGGRPGGAAAAAQGVYGPAGERADPALAPWRRAPRRPGRAARRGVDRDGRAGRRSPGGRCACGEGRGSCPSSTAAAGSASGRMTQGPSRALSLAAAGSLDTVPR